MSSKTDYWVKAKVGEIMNLVNGAPFKPSDWAPEGLPIIRIQNLNNRDAGFNYFNGQIAEKFRVKTDDLLFAWSGTPGTSFGAHIWKGGDAWLNQHIFRVEFDRENLNSEFLRLAINQNLADYVRQAHGGAGLAHITKGKFEDSEVFLPPLNEQRRIVAKLDALFDKSRSIREKLDRLPRLLANLQKSILNSAFRGDLTKEWRAKNPNAEPASELLKRIRAERRAKWEADLIAKAKDPKKAKYVEPEPVDVEGLPELPEGWCWASVEQLSESCLGKMLDAAKNKGKELPYLRNINIRWHCINTNDLLKMKFEDDELVRFGIDDGDVLICEGGEPGRAAVWRGGPTELKFQKALHRVRLFGGIPGEWLTFQLDLDSGTAKLNDLMTGSTIKHLTGAALSRYCVALPPIEELLRILELIRQSQTVVTGLVRKIAEVEAKAINTEKAVLSKAFRGELVPQDPNDEPASVLLERIRAQRLAAGTKRGRGRKAAA